MSKIVRAVIFIVFAIGTILGMLLAGSTIIANLEANFYFGYSYDGEESLRDLDCPVILTGDEVGTVSVSISNPLERAVGPILEAEIGNEGLFRKYHEPISIPAGGSQTQQWTVSRDDVVFGNLILVRLFQFVTFRTPSRDGSCGIFYLDVPFSGTAVLVFSIVISVGGMALGILLWLTLNKSLPVLKTRVSRAMIVMAIFVTLAMVAGLLRIWTLGVLLFVLSVLLIAEVVSSFIASD